MVKKAMKKNDVEPSEIQPRNFVKVMNLKGDGVGWELAMLSEEATLCDPVITCVEAITSPGAQLFGPEKTLSAVASAVQDRPLLEPMAT